MVLQPNWEKKKSLYSIQVIGKCDSLLFTNNELKVVEVFLCGASKLVVDSARVFFFFRGFVLVIGSSNHVLFALLVLFAFRVSFIRSHPTCCTHTHKINSRVLFSCIVLFGSS